MRTIWKFPFDVVDEPTINMPEGAHILKVDVRYGTPTLWAVVDDQAPVVSRRFVVVGTGHPMPDESASYVGSWFDGPFVWHLFQIHPARTDGSAT